MIHSDGVTECAAPDGRLLDDAGLAKVLGELCCIASLSCLEALIWKLAEFTGSDVFADDVSAILLEIKPAVSSG
jgi:sigma-B regulation protein RsbU (phosphoserine phosphatase)